MITNAESFRMRHTRTRKTKKIETYERIEPYKRTTLSSVGKDVRLDKNTRLKAKNLTSNNNEVILKDSMLMSSA